MSYVYIKHVKVLFESRDGVLTISASSDKLYIEAFEEGWGFAKVYAIESSWEDALSPIKLLEAVTLIRGKYAEELQARHEEFLDDLISYWED